MLRDHKLYAENQGYFLGVLAVLAFSLTLPITKYLTPFLSVWDIGFGRSLLAAIGAVIILGFYRRSWPTRRQLWLLLVVASGISFGFPVLTAVGMQSVPSSHGGIILGGLPLMTALIACFLSGERPSPLFWLVPLTVVLGDVTAFQNLPMQGWLAFAFLALINSLVGFFFWYRALAIGGVPKISQIQLLQTFFTFGFAALWLNETITLTMILCLIATIVVVWISKKIPVASTAGD